MIDACHAAGVRVVADSVINHMSAHGSGTGTGGTAFTKYTYPGTYQDRDFHTCRTKIDDYTDRGDVQDCELENLADLHTGTDYVRGRIAAYLDDLASLGVDGYRIDAAKHMAAADLAAIKAKTRNPARTGSRRRSSEPVRPSPPPSTSAPGTCRSSGTRGTSSACSRTRTWPT